MIRIREEKSQDHALIREVILKAFDQPQEAVLVERLRRNCDELLSLVALQNHQIVGHILFSPAFIEGEKRHIEGMGLAPMAVTPEHQRQGIGSELVRAGITRLQRAQCPFVIVLGHAEYYPRFGFQPASRYGVRSEWDVPDDAFMVLVLDKSRIKEISGIAKYRPEFADAI